MGYFNTGIGKKMKDSQKEIVGLERVILEVKD